MNSVTLYPSLLSFGAAALATAFGRPDLASNGAYMGTVVLVVFWLATWIVSRGMKSTDRDQQPRPGPGHDHPGAVPDLLHVRLAGRLQALADPVLGVGDLVPPVSGLSSIALVVGTFVAFAGLEVNAVHIAHLKGPPKNYLKAVMVAAAAVFVMYLLGSLAISVAVPDASLELTSGASQAFTVYADGFGVPGLSNVLSGLLVVGALAASIAWIAGPSRSMWLVGRAGYLPEGAAAARTRTTCRCRCCCCRAPSSRCSRSSSSSRPTPRRRSPCSRTMSVILYMCMYVCHVRLGDQAAAMPSPTSTARSTSAASTVIAGGRTVAALSAIVLGLTPPSGYSSTPWLIYAAIILTGVIVLAIPPQSSTGSAEPNGRPTQIWARKPTADLIARVLASPPFPRFDEGGRDRGAQPFSISPSIA